MAKHALAESLPKRRNLAILPKPPEPTVARLLTVAQVADLLGKTIDAVRMMARRGQLPAVRVGERGIRFKQSEIAQYIEDLPHL